MRYLAVPLWILTLLGCIPGAATATDLFGPGDFSGWAFFSAPAKDLREVCRAGPAGVIEATGTPVGFIATTASYENYRLHAEWRWTGQPGNGGILVHISSGPRDRAWPLCLQIQTKYRNVGDLLPMAGATFAEALAPDQKIPQRPHTAPDSEKPAGEWNVCDIVCRGDTVEVTVNGVLQNRVSGVTPHAGRIGFQFEGAPFALRHVRLEPLD